MIDSTPKILGNYHLLSLIGRGGMARVYKGYHPGLDRLVAVKVLETTSVEQEDFITRFNREAKAVASLRHPNIVQVYDYNVVDNLHYLIMEYIDGPTLERETLERLESERRFSLTEIDLIFKQLAGAVDYAHSQGIVHRDLKPSNIMFRNNDQLVLTDFGIARLIGIPDLTKSGAVIGTLNYMSPEQCQGQEIDRRCDIYSLGIILYEMIAGRLPFIADQAAGLLYQHIHEEPPPLAAFNSDINDDVKQVVLKSLKKNPAERYRTAAEMAEALGNGIASASRGKGTKGSKASPAAQIISSPNLATQPYTGSLDAVGGKEIGISAELLKELRDTLLDCGPFDTNQELNALFVDSRIFPWQDRLPEADNPLERAEIAIDFLNSRFNDEQENALILFLKVLLDRTNPEDNCWQQLNTLANLLEMAHGISEPFQDPILEVNEVAIVEYDEPGVFERPKQLFGREKLLEELRPKLDKHQNLLLHGLAGSGKTALAATIADNLLEKGGQKVIWLQVGNEDFNAVVDALVEKFSEDQEEKKEVRSAIGNGRFMKVRDLLRSRNAGLLVLDDVWDGDALQLLRIMPKEMGAVVTSRYRFPRTHIVDVGDLLPDDAIKLLDHHAGYQGLDQDPYAGRLCETLGYHAYALEIAGNILSVDELLPEQLLANIKDAPHEIRMPGSNEPKERESVAALLETSYELLSEPERTIFLSFGFLFAPGATIQLLGRFIPYNQERVNPILTTLIRRGLVKRRYLRDEKIEFYFVHDLTFHFAKAKAIQAMAVTDEDRITAVLEYLVNNAQAYVHLKLDMANILGAANKASILLPENLVQIMSWLCVGGYPRPVGFGYMDVRGNTLPMLRLLEEASQTASQLNLTEAVHYLWAKQGNAYIDRHEFSRAVDKYSKAVSVSPNPERETMLTSLLGKALSFNGEDDQADQCFAEAEKMANSDSLKEFVYGQQAHAAGQKGDYVAAEHFANKQEIINRNLLAKLENDANNRLDRERGLRGLFRALINKGTARLRSGVGSPSEILEIHEEAKTIADKLGNEEMLAQVHWAFAEALHEMNRRTDAQDSLSEAYRLFTEQGNTKDALEVQKFAGKNNYQLDIAS